MNEHWVFECIRHSPTWPGSWMLQPVAAYTRGLDKAILQRRFSNAWVCCRLRGLTWIAKSQEGLVEDQSECWHQPKRVSPKTTRDTQIMSHLPHLWHPWRFWPSCAGIVSVTYFQWLVISALASFWHWPESKMYLVHCFLAQPVLGEKQSAPSNWSVSAIEVYQTTSQSWNLPLWGFVTRIP